MTDAEVDTDRTARLIQLYQRAVAREERRWQRWSAAYKQSGSLAPHVRALKGQWEEARWLRWRIGHHIPR